MSGMFLIGLGIGIIIISIVLFIASIVYRNTTGKRIREEINRDY